MVQRTSFWKPTISQLAADESGQDIVEYALVAGVIALVAISSVKGLAGKLSTALGTVASTVTSNT